MTQSTRVTIVVLACAYTAMTAALFVIGLTEPVRDCAPRRVLFAETAWAAVVVIGWVIAGFSVMSLLMDRNDDRKSRDEPS